MWQPAPVSLTSRKRRKNASRPRADGPLDRILREIARDLAAAPDALEAELAVSALAGTWWDLDLIDADPETEFGDRLVAQAAGRRSASALALLRVMAELGTPRQRAAAAAGADALAARGVTDPSWLPELTAVRHTGSWAHGDVYGDQTSVLLAFEGPGRPHGLVVLVHHTLGGIAKDVFVTGDTAGVRADLRGLRGPTTWVRDLTPEEAAALLVPAFVATDAGRDLPLGEDLRETRALAVARLRLLPEPGHEDPEPAEDPAALAAEFLATAGPLPDVDPDVHARCVRLVADGMAAIDGRPARVSPTKIDLLYDRLAGELDPDDAARDALQPVLASWADWAAVRAGLPATARQELAEVAAELDVGGDGPPDGLVDALLHDAVDDATGPEELEEILARRLFAIGASPAPVDGGSLALDPSDPDDRTLLVRAEHPEYAELLDSPDALAADGTNPRLHLALHELVANNLWDGDPPGTWPAARRLLAAGRERHDVLHALAEVAARHVHAALVDRRPYDATAHAADLDALGRPEHHRPVGRRSGFR